MPPEDRARSPHTGWTRAHWEAAADGLLAAVVPYATPGGALLHLPGGRPSFSGHRSDGLEGYARTFLLAALRVAGAGGADPHGLLERYAGGLAAGTRRPGGDGPEDWPRVTDRSQPLVESASVALALRLTRPWLWDRLDAAVRERAADWLAGALTAEPWPCNWELFPVTAGGFLAAAGHHRDGAHAARERGLARIEPWYTGGGWYTDGPGRAFDHYNGWAMHLYPVLEAHLSGDAPLLARLGPRLGAHLAGYARLFGGDGAPMHQGRSLTYRMATAAPLWLGALTGHTPLTPGTTRRLASGALRHFLDRGAADPRTGLLTPGWYGPHEGSLQRYSGPASPYWAAKAFLGLLLPPDHPVWTEPEEPAPAEGADTLTTLPGPTWLVQSTAADGIVRLHNHGSEDARYDPHYTRLAYSTATGPTAAGAGTGSAVGGAPGEPPPVPLTEADNHVGLLSADGTLSPRHGLEPLGVGEGWAASRHRVGEAVLVSAVLAHGAAELRVHLVAGAEPGTPIRLTGWAAAPPLVSELLPLHGLSAVLGPPPGPTAFTAAAGVPAVSGETGPGVSLFVCAARLTGEPAPRPLAELVRTETGRDPAGHHTVTAHWPDGSTHRLRLSAEGATAEYRDAQETG
ncbi:DUF2264 domain-containing protein [Streptomyces zingiberis]|uniref:DUF2264 domain-containing protein n=1 Tax=Streptomyces zingiberis TaxID=2053010 RepID=A0ABX1BWW5_9ACTN|nr:DUF2264 domain-containing protein [Streptomyces zingiberis]NJQ00370.1 DUF2264 domain-containing protein [Streptomyces zingiberis]